jgi:hypothetical protein
VWRLPHSITYAHLLLESGDLAGGTQELHAFLAQAEHCFAEGVVSGDLRYWCATACLLLARQADAFAHLEDAVSAGWRHAWWADLDWNLRAWREHPRVATTLARAVPTRVPTATAGTSA